MTSSAPAEAFGHQLSARLFCNNLVSETCSPKTFSGVQSSKPLESPGVPHAPATAYAPLSGRCRTHRPALSPPAGGTVPETGRDMDVNGQQVLCESRVVTKAAATRCLLGAVAAQSDTEGRSPMAWVGRSVQWQEFGLATET